MTTTEADREAPKFSLDQIHMFLLGIAELDGTWFGEKNSKRPGKGYFWWRSDLNKVLAYARRNGEENIGG